MRHLNSYRKVLLNNKGRSYWAVERWLGQRHLLANLIIDPSLIPGIHMVEKKTNSSNYDFYTHTTWNVPTPNHKINKTLNKKDPIGLLVLL